MPDLTPAEARERLAAIVVETTVLPASFAADVRDAFLATTDALAVLVTWPALLAAGERAGKVERFGTYLDPAVYGDKYDHHTFTHCAPIPDGNGQPGNVALYRLTDPEAAP